MASSKLSLLASLGANQVPTDLIYIDDVSAGAAGSKSITPNALFEQITKNITDGVVKGIQATGTDGTGGNLDISGGLGTGAGVPGKVSVRYPLIRASGAILQTLSSDLHQLVTNQYTNVGAGTTISNTAAAMSVFSGLTGSNGSTNVIEGGITRVGSGYRVRVVGNIRNTGTPTLQIKALLDAVTIVDTTAGVMVGANGKFWLDLDINIQSIGATGSVVSFLRFDYSSANTGSVTIGTLNGASGGTTIDLTTNHALDITLQFGTADANNAWTVFDLKIDRSR